MVSATALGACSQDPAPVIQGGQIATAPDDVQIQRVEPVPYDRPPQNVQRQTAREQSTEWAHTADIGVEPIPSPVQYREPAKPVGGAPKSVASAVTKDPDAYEPVSARVGQVKIPRLKPRVSRQIAAVIPRVRPEPDIPPQKKPEIAPVEAVSLPVEKEKPPEAGVFVDIPINPAGAVPAPDPGREIALNTPSSQPDTPEDASRPVTFSWPVTGPVIARYGPSEDGKRNEGINIAVREGARVRAAEAGTIAYVGNELTGYGNLLLVRHESGYVTAYAHNKELLVKRGDLVKKGDVIALAGMSGSVDEPQLHFEVRKGVNAIDPMKYLGRPGTRG